VRIINKALVDAVLRDMGSKNELCVKREPLLLQLYFIVMNFIKYFETNISSYETALYIKSKKNLLHNKGKNHTKAYKIRQIIMVDLGTDTYGSEFSYWHPAIVVHNEFRRLFIVPCTSQPAKIDPKTGDCFPEYVQGETTHGFRKTTTILLNEAKYIDKTRVISELGFVDSRLFDVIYNKLFERLFESKQYAIRFLEKTVAIKEQELTDLFQENEKLRKQLEDLGKT